MTELVAPLLRLALGADLSIRSPRMDEISAETAPTVVVVVVVVVVESFLARMPAAAPFLETVSLKKTRLNQ